MRRTLIVAAVLIVLAVLFVAFFPHGQRPDKSFAVSVAVPKFQSHHPIALYDEAHHNAHIVNLSQSNTAPAA